MKQMRALTFLALTAGSSSPMACGGGPRPEKCHPPQETASVVLPGVWDLSMATFSGTCDAAVASGSVYATGAEILVYKATAGTCSVTAALVNGDTYSFTVTFGRVVTRYCNVTVPNVLAEVDASAPTLVEAGPCHLRDGGAPDTAAGGDGGTTWRSPACATLTTAAGVHPRTACGCTAADPQVCYQPCGPEGRGARADQCRTGVYTEDAVCSFDPATDYSCYRLPAIGQKVRCPADPAGGIAVPQQSAACATDRCVVCNGSGGLPGGVYLDARGVGRAGYCVCGAPDSTGARSWSCADDQDWPCPSASGC